jgi:tripartite-type tricarboxylate transporter receptor subunit TctC
MSKEDLTVGIRNHSEFGKESAMHCIDSPQRLRWRVVAIVLGCAAAMTVCAGALGQGAYPSKPVKIIVGMPAGSFTDLSARLIGSGLQTKLGKPFVVENRPGGATNIATQDVARAPKDGYTLLLSTNSNAMNVSLFKDLPFDIVKDFEPVAMIASSDFILVVTPSLAVSNLKDLIAYATSHPSALNFASTGSGTANHLAVEMLERQANIKVTTVFYKGSTEGITDVLAGRTEAMFAPASTVMPHIEAGKLRGIAVTGKSRTSLAPSLPTMAEAGLPGYEVTMWNGLFAPAGTPDDVVKRLAKAATEAVSSPELQSKIKINGGDPVVMSPKELKDYLQKDIGRWSEAIQAAGIKPQ